MEAQDTRDDRCLDESTRKINVKAKVRSNIEIGCLCNYSFLFTDVNGFIRALGDVSKWLDFAHFCLGRIIPNVIIIS